MKPLIAEPEAAEITWDKSGVVVIYGTQTEWWETKLARRLAIWGVERDGDASR